MSLKEIARQTMKILEQGRYQTPQGKQVLFAEAIANARDNTVLYEPEQLRDLLEQPRNISGTDASPPVIEVTGESTQVAAHRLVRQEGVEDPVLLNYASARNPGGGFLNGAKAQEEDLTRCSGLYPCLLTAPKYYEVNRATSSLLYTDHLIYSPRVPWFRTKSRELLEDVFPASVITAPAPNAGQVLRKGQHTVSEIDDALHRRAGMVLAAARENGHRVLILGAWGCGVFRNDPRKVATAFKQWLESETFLGCFHRVVFAVLDKAKTKETYRAFEDVFRPAD